MIRKLRTKLILLVMAALFFVLAVIIAGMNIVNYRGIISDADTALMAMAENPSTFSEGFFQETEGFQNTKPFEDEESENRRKKEKLDKMDISPGSRLESRYFSAIVDNADGEVISLITSHSFTMDNDIVQDYVDMITGKSKTNGFVDYFRYYKIQEDDTTKIIFLDCGREMDSARFFLLSSTVISLLGYLIVSAIVAYFSGRIIRPIAESYEKQKRFITDAGHEIKTPLAIINADVDVLEMDYEENEWLDDIKKQTKRLTELTNDLVYLARMEEEDRKVEKIEFPVSDLAEEVFDSFQSLAQTQNKRYTSSIQPMLTLKGDEKAVRQLISILLDNALKYSPEGGVVSLDLKKTGKSLTLSVSNTTVSGMDPANLPHLFDRFYRMDSSRNSKTGGHGIGLSIAQAIMAAHGGKIQAATETGHDLKITATWMAV